MLLKIVPPSTRSCGTKGRDVKGGYMDVRQCLRLACFFLNRSTLQCDDILTNQLAANTHVIARETQIFQCAAIN